MTSSDVTLSYNQQLYTIPITPSTTFSSLLQRAHQLYKVKPDVATPFHLTNSSGASFDRLGDGFVLAYIREDRRLMFGPKPPPVKRTLGEVLQSVNAVNCEDDGEEEDDDDDENDDEDDEQARDKENQQLLQEQNVKQAVQTPQKASGASKANTSSPSAALPCADASTAVPLPPSSAPIQSQLWRIYTFYCLQGLKSSSSASPPACPFDSLSSSNWVKLLEDCLIVSTASAGAASASVSSAAALSFSRHQAELLHLTVTKKHGGRFGYDAFLLSLSKTAITAYKHAMSPSQALSSLLVHHVLPFAQRDNPLQHQVLLSHPAISGVLTAFSAYLSAAFTAYSLSSANPDLLSFACFLHWATDCKLTKLVSAAELFRCFVLSMDDDEETRPEGGRLRLTRTGFVQCVSRLIVQGLGRKHTLNAFVAKALFAHCHANLSLQHRLLKATQQDRKALDRMQKTLEAACQQLLKQDGKRDYLQTASAIKAAMPPPPALTPYHQQPWQQLIAQDTTFASLSALLSTQTTDSDTARPAASARLSAGKASRKPATVKTPSSNKPTSTGKKAAKSSKVAAADSPAEVSGLFGSPKTPRVVALVPRTPAAKKSSDGKRRVEVDSDADEDGADGDQAAEQLLAGKQAAVAQEEKQRQQQHDQERAKGNQAEEVQRRQQEQSEREERWKREKEAEVARVREQERLEREQKELQMQKEIQLLREQLAAQQSNGRAPTQQPAAAGAAASRTAVAAEEEDDNDNNVKVIGRSSKDQGAAAAPLTASLPSGSRPSRSSVSKAQAAAPAPPAAPTPSVATRDAFATPAIASAPAQSHVDRPLPTTVLPAKRPSLHLETTSRKDEQRPLVAHTDIVEQKGANAVMVPATPVKVAAQTHEDAERDEDEQEDDSEEEEEEEDAVQKQDNLRLMFNASMSRLDSSDDDDDDDDSYRQDTQEHKQQPAPSLEDDDDSGEDADDTVGPFTVAIDCSYSVNHSLDPNAEEDDDDDDQDDDGEQSAPVSGTDDACTIHSNNISRSQSHSPPPHLAQLQSVPAAGKEDMERDEEEDVLDGPAVYPAPFDEALHEERLRALQAELKERLEGRRRLLRRASYMEELEDKRLQEELRAKQKALAQLRMLRAKQERERAQAEEQAERQRRQLQQEQLQAERLRAAALQAAAAVPESPSLSQQRAEAQWASLVRCVERGDTFTRYYSGWWRKPKSKFFRVSDASSRLYWGPDLFHLDKFIELAEIVAVKEACTSAAAGLLPLDLLGCGLTLECGERELHLLASSHATREVWRRYFEGVVQRRKDKEKDSSNAHDSVTAVKPVVRHSWSRTFSRVR